MILQDKDKLGRKEGRNVSECVGNGRGKGIIERKMYNICIPK